MTPKELNAIAAKLAAQVANIRRKKADVIPPGWFTAQQISRATGCDVSKALVHIKMVGAEKKKFYVMCGSQLQSIPHYRLK